MKRCKYRTELVKTCPNHQCRYADIESGHCCYGAQEEYDEDFSFGSYY